jgi:hypothetical protein
MRRRMLGARSVVVLACSLTGLAQQTTPLYQNDFEKAAIGKVPDDIAVLDGAFAVQQDQGNKFLELPGAPLDSYTVLFGPSEKDGMVAAARIYATSKGRRFPTFGLGVMGASGYRLQVAPAKKVVELYRSDTFKVSSPYDWSSGKWIHLRLQARKTSSGWHVEGKVWTEGQPEPEAWTISTEDKDDLPAGRAGVFGSPFSGTPIRFDDLVVRRPLTAE